MITIAAAAQAQTIFEEGVEASHTNGIVQAEIDRRIGEHRQLTQVGRKWAHQGDSLAACRKPALRRAFWKARRPISSASNFE